MMFSSRIRCVEVWYDRRSRNWIAQGYDADGNDCGSDYTGTREDAMAAANSYQVPVFRTNPYGERMA